MFTLPRSSDLNAHTNYYSDGFNLIFHDDSIGKRWTNSNGTSYLNTNWNNAQKSPRFYLLENEVKRFSHTFTTGTGVGTTRVGINFPFMNGYGALFYGIQLEKKQNVTYLHLHLFLISGCHKCPADFNETRP